MQLGQASMASSCQIVLISDVLPYHRFVSTYGRDEVSSCPEVLPHKILLLLSVYTGQMDRALALDETDHLRNRIFGGMEIIM